MKGAFVWLLLAGALATTDDFLGSTESLSTDLDCAKCRGTIDYLQNTLKNPALYGQIRALVTNLCVGFLFPNLAECQGYIATFEGTVSTILAEVILDSDFICPQLGWCKTPTYEVQDFDEWAKKIMRGKPWHEELDKKPESTFTFVHVSDIHLDMEYVAGTNDLCGLTTCCRNGTGAAGVYGGRVCDTAMATIQASIMQIRDMNPDFVIITGDIPPHDGWKQTKATNLAHQKAVADVFTTIAPDLVVYPIYGNHAMNPINQYNYNGGENWLPEPFTEYWGLSEDIKNQLLAHAGYSVLHKNTKLRLIAIDTQTGNNQNVWLLVNSTDPQGVVSWLYSELLKAEKNKEKVYLYGHIPIGHADTITAYAKHMNVLVDRFEYTIVGLFYGHTHSDELQVSRGVFSDKPTNVQWINPSLTTWRNRQPSFRRFHACSSTKRIVDYDQFRLNLTDANLNPTETPTWDIAYSFKELYGVKDLSAKSIFNLGVSMGGSEDLAVKYYSNINNGTVVTSCNDECRRELQCALTNGISDDVFNCIGFPAGWLQKTLDFVYGQWTYKKN